MSYIDDGDHACKNMGAIGNSFNHDGLRIAASRNDIDSGRKLTCHYSKAHGGSMEISGDKWERQQLGNQLPTLW